MQTDLAISGRVAASGTGTLTVRPTRGQTWTVRQVSIEAPDVGFSSSCAVYKNGSAISPLVPQMDAAAGEPPIILHPSDVMTIVWTGGTSQALLKALITYDDGTPS